MKVVLTGAAGYVGSTLTPLLLHAGHQVTGVDCLLHGGSALLPVWARPEFKFIRGDLRDVKVREQALSGADAVIHLAAIVGDPACARDPELARAVNLDSSLSLIAEAQRAGVQRFVFASTCSNYGKMQGSAYVDETSELRPISLYAATKVAVETALLQSSASANWCVTPLRFATVYGVSGRMRFDLTVNEFTRDLLTSKHLKVFGEQFWRPYIHVLDAARAIVQVLAAPEKIVDRVVFNVGATDQNFTKQHLVEMILPYAPGARVDYVSRAEDPRDYRVSFSRIADRLGFRLTRTVADGVAEIARLIESGVLDRLDDPGYSN